MIKEFKKARRAGVPIINIHSMDPEATMQTIQTAVSEVPIIQWDIISGWKSRNVAGREAMATLSNTATVDQMSTINPTKALESALYLPERSVLFVLNPRFFVERPDYVQALWSLRDDFKSELKTCVLIGSHFTIPAELQNDILTIDEPLPEDEELTAILDDLISENEIKLPKEQKALTVDAIRGLGAFTAEQAIAMNLQKDGIDVQGLWERKRQMISETPGLKVYKDEVKFDQIGGCDQIKKFLSGVIKGKDSPRVVVFIDEGEKMFSGATGIGDSSGVSQDYLGTMLSYMEDNDCDGSIFVGPPGAAKSAMAKAFGNEAEIPTIVLDLGGMKGSLVGQSETRLRTALKVITAVGSGKAFFIMTCNKIAALPPELKRRFTSGTFFFDLPTAPERKLIWDLYIKKYGLGESSSKITFDQNWTGAEIRNCCRMAYRQSISLKEAAEYIVPVAVSANDQIQSLRTQASGAFLSANHSGLYEYDPEQTKAPAKRRKMNL